MQVLVVRTVRTYSYHFLPMYTVQCRTYTSSLTLQDRPIASNKKGPISLLEQTVNIMFDMGTTTRNATNNDDAGGAVADVQQLMQVVLRPSDKSAGGDFKPTAHADGATAAFCTICKLGDSNVTVATIESFELSLEGTEENAEDMLSSGLYRRRGLVFLSIFALSCVLFWGAIFTDLFLPKEGDAAVSASGMPCCANATPLTSINDKVCVGQKDGPDVCCLVCEGYTPTFPKLSNEAATSLSAIEHPCCALRKWEDYEGRIRCIQDEYPKCCQVCSLGTKSTTP
jgi:hypothetical protein